MLVTVVLTLKTRIEKENEFKEYFFIINANIFADFSFSLALKENYKEKEMRKTRRISQF